MGVPVLGRQFERQRRVVHDALVRLLVEFARLIFFHRVGKSTDEATFLRLERHLSIVARFLFVGIGPLDENRDGSIFQRLAVPEHRQLNFLACHVRHDFELQFFGRAGGVDRLGRRAVHMLGVVHQERVAVDSVLLTRFNYGRFFVGQGADVTDAVVGFDALRGNFSSLAIGRAAPQFRFSELIWEVIRFLGRAFAEEQQSLRLAVDRHGFDPQEMCVARRRDGNDRNCANDPGRAMKRFKIHEVLGLAEIADVCSEIILFVNNQQKGGRLKLGVRHGVCVALPFRWSVASRRRSRFHFRRALPMLFVLRARSHRKGNGLTRRAKRIEHRQDDRCGKRGDYLAGRSSLSY